MKTFQKFIFFSVLGVLSAVLLTFMSCQKPQPVVLNPDLTSEIVGPYSGNYVVNYETHPEDNYSSQVTLVVTRVDKTVVKIDTQGGDSFECNISGTDKNLTLKNILNPTGIFVNANNLEGAYYNERLYYKVTGTSNGGSFTAEFTAI